MSLFFNARETLELLTQKRELFYSPSLLEKKTLVYEAINAQDSLREDQRSKEGSFFSR